MDESLNQVGNENVVTTATPSVEGQTPALNEPKERMYSKAEVQELMKRRVSRSHNAFFKRYGATDLNGMDELFNQSKKFGNDYAKIQSDYGELNNRYNELSVKNSELQRELSFIKNNVNPEKYEDIIAYFKGTNAELNEENLINALKTHPEWLNKTTTIQKLGQEFSDVASPSERELASRYLGVKV